jgi:tyrosyl-tRNA synthetase
MLAKEVVASRLEAGISFTEFTYQILQAIDFEHLYMNHDVQLQIGGADQWGNITSGIDMIHKMHGSDVEVYGLTIPLMLKSDGTKFGKTAGGAIWLDPEKTSPFEFYQFWLNQDDADVIKYLKYFTFLSQEEINSLAEAVQNEPEKRLAQRRLAEEVTRFVHSPEALKEAQNITEALYHGSIADLSEHELEQAFGKMPTVDVSNEEKDVVTWLVDSGIYKSKRQAREDVNNGAVTINGIKVQSVDESVHPHKNSNGKYVIVRKGKKKYTLARVH